MTSVQKRGARYVPQVAGRFKAQTSLEEQQGTVYLKRSPVQKAGRSQGSSLGVGAAAVAICGIALYWLPWVNLICPAGLMILGAVGLQNTCEGAVPSKLSAATALVLGGALFLLGLFVIEVALSLAAVQGQPGEASP